VPEQVQAPTRPGGYLTICHSALFRARPNLSLWRRACPWIFLDQGEIERDFTFFSSFLSREGEAFSLEGIGSLNKFRQKVRVRGLIEE
jgi:hypothetical protein